MTQMHFREFVYDLSDYYERKRPQDSTLDLWFDEVRNIPDEPLEWIKGKIFKENDTKPTNLPAIMWALYNAWLQANPHKRAFAQERDCPDCEGGWLVLQKRLPMYAIPISHSAPCGRCKQIPAAQYMTLFQAKEKGFERVNLFDLNAPKRTIKEMIASIGRPVPTPRVYCD